MKILICNNVFHSVMSDAENEPPATQTIDGLTYDSEIIQVTDTLKNFYPSCIWDGSNFSEPAQNKLSSQEVTDYWTDVENRLNG